MAQTKKNAVSGGKSALSKGSLVLAIAGGLLFAVGHIAWIAFLAAAVIFLVIVSLFGSALS